MASEPEGAGLLDDEPEEGEEGAAGDVGGGGDTGTGGAGGPEALPSPWAELPGGRRFGTLVHSAMERVDFFAPDLEAELGAVVDSQLAYHRMDLDREAFVAALAQMIETPLGPAARGMRLRELMPKDRLDELTFELPLVGGDIPKGKLDVRAIGDLLAERLPAGDPLAAYAATLCEAELGQAVRGYLTGSIDLALRFTDQELMAPKFFVVDYKTNWLGAAEEPLTTHHYRPEAVAAEMERGHYWLQALLYLVALHRYLRWRLPDYDAELNLGGALYLFVRGMAGPETPADDGTPAGVVAWQPPAGVIEELSALLDEGSGS
ncbi:MAG: PD-(D/E)XK nuclease family protein [Solirubrobacterales bacterium]